MPAAAPPSTVARALIPTPLGDMLALADDAGLRLLDFTDRKHIADHLARIAADHVPADADHPHLSAARAALDAYFAGHAAPLSDLRLAPWPDPTPFRARCWAFLRTIPLGQTRTYAQQAAGLGFPPAARAARAVGQANAANVLSIVVPCHRVIGSGGVLTGYAGGEARKRWLIDHERRCSC
jgi:O-6-methylguanine DNA methyltransferase